MELQNIYRLRDHIKLVSSYFIKFNIDNNNNRNNRHNDTNNGSNRHDNQSFLNVLLFYLKFGLLSRISEFSQFKNTQINSFFYYLFNY